MEFFGTKEMCILYFVKYWPEWKRKGKLNDYSGAKYATIPE